MRQSKKTVCMVLLIVTQAIAILWILYAPETSDALVEGWLPKFRPSRTKPTLLKTLNPTEPDTFFQPPPRIQDVTTVRSVVKVPENLTRSHEERYFIYYCSHFCGGWGDRLKGIVFAYIFASLTNRRFGIDIPQMPCNLTSFLLPNEVQWNVSLDSRDTREAKMYSKLSGRYSAKVNSSVDFDAEFPDRVIRFKTTSAGYEIVKSFTRYQKQIAWLKPFTRSDIFVKIYSKLFRLAPATQKAFDKVMQKAKPEPEGLLLCAHLRMGNNGNISFRDSERRHTYQHGDTVLRFLLQYDHEIKRKVLTGTAVGEPKMKENGTGHQSFALAMLRNRRDLINPSNSFHGDDRNVTSSGAFPAVPTVRLFVASDSEDFVNKAEKLFGERFVRTEGKVVHIDRPKTKQETCDGFTKVLVDQKLLSRCDVLVVSKSVMGRQAAYLRQTDEGLYCILMNGTLVKCSRQNLPALYYKKQRKVPTASKTVLKKGKQ